MKLRITSPANADLRAISEYLNARNPKAAGSVGERIFRTLSLIQTSSRIGRATAFADVREFPVRDLPYLILYRTTGDTVEIIRVFHTSQHPTGKI